MTRWPASLITMAEQQFFVGIHGVIASRGRMLVLKRAPNMSYRAGSWDLPGGHLALGESFEDLPAARGQRRNRARRRDRPLARIAQHGSGALYAGVLSCRLTVFQNVKLRPDEHVEHRWVTLDELASLELIPYLAAILKRGMLSYVKGSTRARYLAIKRPRQ